MKKFRDHTLKQYLEVLSLKRSVPGGGSAAALTGALGAALIAMVAQYSQGKTDAKSAEKRILRILKESNRIKDELLECVDLDAEFYKKVIEAPKLSKQRAKAERTARRIPKQVCKLCYKAIDLTPYLVQKGNLNLIGDVEVAVEMLFAAYKSAMTLSKS